MHSTAISVLIAIALCLTTVYAEKNAPLEAIAVIEGGKIKGNVTFTQNACGENVHIHVYLMGLEPGKHGFHVHEKGSTVQGCASMGAHFNPDKLNHGAPNDEVRHVGDLGNIEANASGVVDITFTDHVISLTGKNSIIGRGVVVHDMVDDLGQGDHPDSKKTGNAGGRAACGIIAVNELDEDWDCAKDMSPNLQINALLLVFLVVAKNLF